MSFIQFQKYKLSKILQDGLDYIFENQEEKHKYAHYDFISVVF
jgi:hypothetical protein